MKHELLKHLVCPKTGADLELHVTEEKHGQIKEGSLTSTQTGDVYPIRNYVPRFVSNDQYVASFSDERAYVERHFKHYMRDRSGFALFYPTTGFSKEQLTRGLTLEAGCGYGRFVDVVEKEGGEIVGCDLSTKSINLAQSFVGLRPRVHLVQSDIFRLPFRRETFHSIYSIGVLHHTPDCKRSFQALTSFLAPGGQISIWLYHPDNQANENPWRRILSQWPRSAVYAWCIVNQTLFSPVRMLPFVRWKFNKLIPGSVPKKGQHFWLRVLEDFDNFSPSYASSHTPNEVVKWFEEASLANVRALERLTAVTGFRP